VTAEILDAMATYIALKKHQATPLLDQYQDSLKKA
jgi:hypothetical protein